MRKYTGLIGILFVCFFSSQVYAKGRFYSKDSLPVLLTYDTHFNIPVEEFTELIEVQNGAVLLSENNRNRVDEILHLHVLHLVGAFTFHQTPLDYSRSPGGVKEGAHTEITDLNLEDPQTLVVRYRFVGEAVFHDSLLGGLMEKDISFYLPNTPTTIYKSGFPKVPVLDPKTKKPLNLCTSFEDNSEAGFWYFWNPYQPRCPKKMQKEIHLVQAHLKVLPSTKQTYPEYKMLLDLNERRPAIQVSIIVGVDASLEDPEDLGQLTFQHVNGNFRALKNDQGEPLFQEVHKGKFQKGFSYKQGETQALIRVFFVKPDTGNWLEFVKKILRESDVMIYSGHSAEGHEFDPKRIFEGEAMLLPEKKYQIFFFNACTTYSVYPFFYFDVKKDSQTDPQGTKYLDVMTNAIGAPFTSSVETIAEHTPIAETILTLALLGLDPRGKKVSAWWSWQQIMDHITQIAGENTALTNVVGDEDNPVTLWELP